MTSAALLNVESDGAPTVPLVDAIRVPETLADEIDIVVARVSEKTGEPPVRVRRAVEIAIIQRGLERLKEGL
jgi:hypothetical protein